jgi:hypothetical protein
VPGEHAGDVFGVGLVVGFAGGLVDVAEQHRDELPLRAGGERRAVAAGFVGGVGGGRLGRHLGGGEQVEHRVLGEDGLLQALQADARLDAQLVDQRQAGRAVGGQRLGLPAAAVQGEHQLAVQVLAERMLPDQRLQLTDQLLVAAEVQVGLDARLQGHHAELVEADQFRPGHAAGGDDVGQDRPAPQRQRLVQQARGGGRVALGQRAPSLLGALLEAVQVELVGVDAQEVAGLAGEQRAGRGRPGSARLDRLAQRRHVVLERLLDCGRRFLTPDRVDQLVGGDHLVGVEEELGEEHAVLDAAELEGSPAVAVARFQGTEEEEVDWGSHAAAPSVAGDGARPGPSRLSQPRPAEPWRTIRRPAGQQPLAGVAAAMGWAMLHSRQERGARRSPRRRNRDPCAHLDQTPRLPNLPGSHCFHGFRGFRTVGVYVRYGG